MVLRMQATTSLVRDREVGLDLLHMDDFSFFMLLFLKKHGIIYARLKLPILLIFCKKKKGRIIMLICFKVARVFVHLCSFFT